MTAREGVALAVGVAVAAALPHVYDYLNPVFCGVAAWAYAAHPRARWLLERRT